LIASRQGLIKLGSRLVGAGWFQQQGFFARLSILNQSLGQSLGMSGTSSRIGQNNDVVHWRRARFN
jgi:hypothetical protein